MNIVYDGLIFLGGFIDSIAGGGGLVTLPVFTILVGPGPEAIGTNKIVAVAAAAVALAIYSRNGHLRFKIALPFLIATAVGTVIGAEVAMFLPKEAFKYFLVIVAPIILTVTFRKNAFISEHSAQPTGNDLKKRFFALALSGFLCGVYDGIFGPGGGTFMLVALVAVARLPLMLALTTSKLANVISAAGALLTYASKGQVHWGLGLRLAFFVSCGALVGSQLASRKSEKIVRPILVVVVALLLIKVLSQG